MPKISSAVFQAAVRPGNIPEPPQEPLLIEGIKVPESCRPGEFQGSCRAGAALCNFFVEKKSPFWAGFPVFFQEMFDIFMEEHQCWGCQDGPVGGGLLVKG